MMRKTLAALTIAATLMLAAPTAANADQYTKGAPCRFDLLSSQAGGTATLICVPGTWSASELVD
ncbi:ABC transporter ATP-binding protein [Leifsonia xyli subsp. cynodontis DSM 46306]|jgi:hypothetical protein|uniref:Secreted protein n=1 Tax=Leifsonia xyli subsp. cynodontis DSM 46306 TaxID=1389489 RepID=U3PA00_LEIXC|nr:ABC transporter ATP-binding protein [Leifsonia xyli]AGW42339.1 ABC transporter ATP-binding protein [Leifsonia xyli subsp. cynodontis DSM 46306]